MRRIIPSITTIGTTESTWRNKVAEIETLRLKEVALFVTCLRQPEREECYKLLGELRSRHYFEIPFVHAVSDMPEEEFWKLHDAFGTERFNLHPVREYPLKYELSAQLRKRIYIENATPDLMLDEKDIEGFAGLCVDLSHLEDLRRASPDAFERFLVLSRKFPIGANHISAVRSSPVCIARGRCYYSDHVMRSPADFDYLFNIPADLFSMFCAIELENSLKEQSAMIGSVAAAADRNNFLRKTG